MVSVLLASYNGEKYIRSQLDSVLKQTYKDLTLVISDDLSTDGTPGIIKEYEKAFPDRIKSLKNKERSGSAQNNFFHLLSSVSDEYLMLCDQDDRWVPDKAEATFLEMKRMEAVFGKNTPILVHGDLSVTDKEGRIMKQSMAKYQKISVQDNRFSHYLVENNITGNTVMLNRALKELLISIPKASVMHDWWLGLLASCFGEISYIDRPLVLYRQHEGNQVGAQSGMKQCAKNLKNKQSVRENYKKMFDQAEAFLTIYETKLSRQHKETLKHFLALPKKNRVLKMYTIWKYRLFKSTPIRTIGQMFSI